MMSSNVSNEMKNASFFTGASQASVFSVDLEISVSDILSVSLWLILSTRSESSIERMNWDFSAPPAPGL